MAIVAATKPNSTRRKNVAGIAELLLLLARGAQYLSSRWGPTPSAGRLKAVARSHSAARLCRASLRRATPTRLPRWGPRRLARAAGAITCSRGPISFIALAPHPHPGPAHGCRYLPLGGSAL